ncbi:MAG TPA: prolyl oligopeptidase family serine peptidase [Steroidobacteraceae bacterium]|nr:prolyl oligopeptidase family serine peptidase [Steroidobacteraceae bacterium]
MGRKRRLRPIPFAAGMAWLLAGCSLLVGRPTPVPGPGRLDVPQPTATQIGVGANPNPSAPRINQFVAQVNPPGAHRTPNPYAWLEDVHSARTQHWIAAENRSAAKVLAAIPQRAWIGSRLEQRQGAGHAGTANDVVVERAFYVASDGTRLPMQIAHRRDLARDGNRPTLLTVYRATRKPPGRLLDPFASVWLDMGGVYARAAVRDGLAPISAPPPGVRTLPDRSIALSDLFAAAQSLIDQHYTRRARLGIYGRGFAGLMAGAAVTLRPDFFGAGLPTGTWQQYRQIASGNCFPPTLITTAEDDGSIRPWEGYELAAVLQAEQVCRQHPILIQVGVDDEEPPGAGRLHAAADELAFAAKWLGVKPAR